jgi:DNA-binding NtrC family response regulator
MSEKNDFALVPRPPAALEKAEPGARRILSGMVADTLALAKQGPPRGSRPLRIVSMDDEDWHLEVIEMIISGFFKGVTVQSFLDAEEAWQELSRTAPDLLITDDLMGKLTGEEIVRRLGDRKVAYPIIVINGYGPERDQWVLDCVKRGVDVTLLRAPYDVERLVRALESALRIPRDLATPDETKPIKNQTKTPKPRGKLLIVDDEDGVRQCMRVVFKGEYDLFMARDGPTAIELAKQNDIDVAVTNIRMAEMSGIELLERLKSLKPDIEVIMMTGYETTDTLRQALRLGACDYINKPFDSSTMRAVVNKAMQHRTFTRIKD